MEPIIAVLGEDTVTLKSDFIYEFMGRGYLYTYQTIGVCCVCIRYMVFGFTVIISVSLVIRILLNQ